MSTTATTTSPGQLATDLLVRLNETAHKEASLAFDVVDGLSGRHKKFHFERSLIPGDGTKGVTHSLRVQINGNKFEFYHYDDREPRWQAAQDT